MTLLIGVCIGLLIGIVIGFVLTFCMVGVYDAVDETERPGRNF